MSGVLRRLVRRTLEGGQPVVHSVARVRYVALPELLQPDYLPSAGERATPPAEDLRPAVRTPMPGQALSDAPDEPPPVPSPVTGTGNIADPGTPPEAGLHSDLADSAGMTDGVVTRHTKVWPRATGRIPIHEHPASSDRDPLPAEIVRGREREESLTDPVADRPAAQTERTVLPAGHSVVLPLPPSRLVSEVVEAQSGTSIDSVSAGRNLSPPDRSQGEEAVEVHVTIGRIEVTAVHEPSPPKRTRRPARKPMSLDEYLAKRKGREG